LFAALIGTGGVVDVAARNLRHVGFARDFYAAIVEGTFPGTGFFRLYVRQLALLEPSRATWTVSVLTLACVLFVILALLSQGALLASASHAQELPVREAVRAGRRKFFDLLSLALLSRLASAVCVVLASVPLAYYLTTGSAQDAAAYVLSFLVFFPLAIAVAVISMLAAIDIVRENAGVLLSIRQAIRMFGRHAVSCLELGVLLFGVSLLIYFGAAVVLILLSIPFGVMLNFALLSGVPFVFVLVHVIGILVAATVIVAAAGGTVAFQYVAWTLFYERALHRNAVVRLASKLERLLD
jgi:hypothetical protein